MSVSIIDTVLAKHNIISDLEQHDVTSLYEALKRVKDPRQKRGIRYPFTDLLLICAAAVASNARSITVIHEWATHARDILHAHNIRVPSLSTIQRVLTLVNAELLDAAISGWARNCARHKAQADDSHPQVLSIDGKALRGSASTDSAATFLLAAIDQRTGTVLAQTRIPGKTNEIPYFQPLLNEFSQLTGVVVTADALHTQHEHAHYLNRRGAFYVFTVKGNQPTLLKSIQTLNWKNAPVCTKSTEKIGGRLVTRTVRAVPCPPRVRFPGATQVLQITRSLHGATADTSVAEIVYVITNVPVTLATGRVIALWLRQHWHIENRVHWVRDVTFDEDRSQTRTQNAAHAMASFRNAAINIHRLAGETNIAKALRTTDRNPMRGLQLVL